MAARTRSQKESMAALYHARKARGECVRCGLPAIEGRVRCRSCIEIQRAAQRTYGAPPPKRAAAARKRGATAGSRGPVSEYPDRLAYWRAAQKTPALVRAAIEAEQADIIRRSAESRAKRARDALTTAED